MEDCQNAPASKEAWSDATDAEKVRVYGNVLTEPGTRHTAMLQMAVTCRYSGDSKQTCLDTLTEWYRQQPKEMIRSSLREVETDIREIVKWAYGPAFQVHTGMGATITEEDVRRILGLKRRSEQRVLFLLMVRCGAGKRQIKQNSIAYITGMSLVTVNKAVQNLEAEGLIRRTFGRKWYDKGWFKSESTRYDVPVCKLKKGMRCVNVTLSRLQEDFQTVFQETIDMLGKKA